MGMTELKENYGRNFYDLLREANWMQSLMSHISGVLGALYKRGQAHEEAGNKKFYLSLNAKI